MDKKKCFYAALKEYFCQSELHPLDEGRKLEETGEYHLFYPLPSYTEKDSKTTYYRVVPTTVEAAFFQQIDKIFDSRIGQQLVSSTINQTIDEFGRFPFKDKKLVIDEKFSDKIFETLIWYFESEAEALVPLYNIMCLDNMEMTLANAVLHSGGAQSLLTEKANHSVFKNQFPKMAEEIADKCFLCIPVAGGSENRLEQAERETEKALKVLRFVTPWQSVIKGNKEVMINRASKVSQWKTDWRTVLFDQPDKPKNMPGFNSSIQQFLKTDSQVVDNAREYFGLDDINYHYQNIGHPISDRVQRALALYDSGTRAITNWEALYQYVVSINVVIPTSASEKDKLKQDLETLIRYGGYYYYYVGKMRKDESLSEPEKTTWKEMVKLTAKPFAEFYKLRGMILHGNEMDEDLISNANVEEARTLAHNAVRLFAKLAREFNWKDYKDAKRWFKSPSYPLSVKPSENE